MSGERPSRKPGRPRKQAPAFSYGKSDSVGRPYQAVAPFVAYLGDDEGLNRRGLRGPNFWARVWTLSPKDRRLEIARAPVAR